MGTVQSLLHDTIKSEQPSYHRLTTICDLCNAILNDPQLTNPFNKIDVYLARQIARHGQYIYDVLEGKAAVETRVVDALMADVSKILKLLADPEREHGALPDKAWTDAIDFITTKNSASYA